MTISNQNPNDRVIIAKFYLSKLFPKWFSCIINIASNIEKTFNYKFKYNTSYHRYKSGSVKMINEKNIDSLFNRVNKEGSEHITGIQLSDTKIEDPDFILKYDNGKIGGLYSYVDLYFHANMRFFEKTNTNAVDFYVWLFEQLRAAGQIEYGLMNPTTMGKYGPFYLAFSQPQSTNEEKEKFEIWSSNVNSNQYKEKIWDVHLGNVLNANHVKNTDIKQQIEKIVGNHNVLYFGDIMLFFLPVDLYAWIERTQESINLMETIREIFNTHDLIMKKVPPSAKRGKRSKYKSPKYTEEYLAKGARTIIKEIHESYDMVTSGVARDNNKSFNVLIDENNRIVGISDKVGIINIYDPSKHPANINYENHLTPSFVEYRCGNCGGSLFEIVVGYEYPQDADGQDDISCFALAGKCIKCNNIRIIFEDETA